ncbi:hypothetical protein HN51_002529 [Arachis hypogaea]|nr:cell wall / vacuolar inhibitor of fructosidase 1-like [Arachis hypogaea]
MTNLKTTTTLFFFLFLIVMTSLPSITLGDEKLIESTCRQTPNFNLCVQSLKSFPGSATADVRGLGLIMVKVMQSKANDAINKIRELQRSAPSPALTSCASKYNAIVVGDIPEANEAFSKGMPKFAENGANDAANEATFCENGFNGRSPLTQQNNAMRDVAAITAAIARQLL